MDREIMAVLEVAIPVGTILAIVRFAYSPTDETLITIGMAAIFLGCVISLGFLASYCNEKAGGR